MILNAPTAESLNKVALRLYFNAWTELLEMLLDFQREFDGFEVSKPPQPGDFWEEEWNEYLSNCQEDIRTSCSIVQQSNELALKAKLCAVTPYLLLLKTEPKLSDAPQDLDFSDLRTLDAVDLPGAVNTFCDRPLSDKFVQMYGSFRKLRNKVAHLGSANETFMPQGLMRMMVDQFIELWPDRSWLSEWVAVEAGSRYSIFHDFRHNSPYADVLHQWPTAVELIGKRQFQKLFGFPKARRRYHCPQCAEAAKTKYSDPWEDSETATAFLGETEDEVTCALCRRSWAVQRRKCGSCPGNVVCDDQVDSGRCLTCGDYP